MEINFQDTSEKNYNSDPATNSGINWDEGSVWSNGETLQEESKDSVGEHSLDHNYSLFKKIVRNIVYLAAFLTPLLFLPFTADVLEFNKQVLLITTAGVGLVLYLIGIIKGGVIRYRPSKFYLPLFGLIIAGIVSIIFSINRNASLFGMANDRSSSLITLIAFVILFCLAVNTIEDRGRTLRRVMMLSWSLTFLFAILQIFGFYLFDNSIFASRAFNSVGALNSLGILAALAIAFFASPGLYGAEINNEERTDRWSRIMSVVSYFGLALALFILILINWWPIWTVAFISIIGSMSFILAGDASLLRRRKIRLFVVPMIVVVLGAFLMITNFSLTSLKSKLPLEVALIQKVSWSLAWDSIKSRPMGYGSENFIIAYDKFRPTSVVNNILHQVRFTDAASEAVDVVIEGGILAILAFLGLLGVYFSKLISSLRRGFNGSFNSIVSWASSIGLLIAFFLYPFNITIYMTLFLLLALVVLSSSESDQEKAINLETDAKYSFAGSVIFIVGLVIVLVGGYFTVNHYRSNFYLLKASKVADYNEAIGYFVKSYGSNSRDDRIYRLMSQKVLELLAQELKAGPKKDESKEKYNARLEGYVASAINVSIRATDIDPNNSQNWMNRGLIYQNLISLVSGADQAAINAYNEALMRNPNDPLTYLRMGEIYIVLADNLQIAINNSRVSNVASAKKQISDNLVKAEGILKNAVTLYNNYGQALYDLAVVYDRQGKLAEAIKQFEKLQAANPNEPSIAFQLGLLYYRRNQKNDALVAWQRAVLLFPNYSNARWYLSLIYEERGELGKALEQVKEIEKFNPDNELVAQRINQLQAGQRIIPPGKLLDQEPLNQ